MGLMLCLVLVASMGREGDRISIAQESAATPATAATPLAIDFTRLVAERAAVIHDGSCDEPGETVATLTPVSRSEGEAVGQGQARGEVLCGRPASVAVLPP